MFFQKNACQWLIVGLGNPGRQYENTRHNAGYLAIDRLAGELGVTIDRVRFRGRTAMASYAGTKLCLLKPDTFMNLSGDSVQLAAMFYKIPVEHIIVLFDDISLPPGRIRVRADGSAGGHNGIKSIIARLGGQDFPRVKIGVGAKPNPDYDLADWVLSRFSASEKQALDPALDRAAKAVLEIIGHGVQSAANLYNGK